jgi:hypothetical protein
LIWCIAARDAGDITCKHDLPPNERPPTPSQPRFYYDRPGIASLALTTDSSILPAPWRGGTVSVTMLQARLEDEAQCLLVIIGATAEGKKELVGLLGEKCTRPIAQHLSQRIRKSPWLGELRYSVDP